MKGFSPGNLEALEFAFEFIKSLNNLEYTGYSLCTISVMLFCYGCVVYFYAAREQEASLKEWKISPER